MRAIRPVVPNDPAWSKWIKDCEVATTVILEAVGRGEAPYIDKELYRRRKIRDIYFFSGGTPFFGKCAYCEHPIALIDGDIDHFRPKLEVCDLDGRPVWILTEDGNSQKHPGYFWLAYDWKNLLPSCRSCNRKYKRSLFPVVGKHATQAGDLAAEEPILLNPLSDEPDEAPKDHLLVTDQGMIIGLSDRGRDTIRILGLDREGLRRSRALAYRAAVGVWYHLHYGEPAEQAIAVQSLKDIRDGCEPHFLAQQAALDDLASRAGISATG